MLLRVSDIELLNKAIEKPTKKISRTEAKGAHKKLPDGGAWRTVRGHHIYIVGNKVVAGALPKLRGTGAKKATKEHLQEYQNHVDKENKKKAPTKKQKTAQKAPVKKKVTKPKTKTNAAKQTVIYHGTSLAHVSSIKKHGFKPNGHFADFGSCTYFKTPETDSKEKEARFQTSDIINSFGFAQFRGEANYKPAIIKASIPSEHILDVTKKRPKDLQKLLKESKEASYESNDTATSDVVRRPEKVQKYYKSLYKLATGKTAPKTLTKNSLHKALANYPSLQKMLKKDGVLSPYEAYATVNGYKAVLDVIDHYETEGYQIGVYDPSIIKYMDHGKQLTGSGKGTKLQKSLSGNPSQPPYTLLQTQKDGDHYHLYIGAVDEIQKSAMLYVLL